MKAILVVLALWLAGCSAAPVATAPLGEPPPPRAENVAPRQGFVWVRGHWSSDGGAWAWKDGYWERERPGMTWTDGRWEKDGATFRWVPGAWTPAR